MTTVTEPAQAQTNVRQFRDDRQKLKIKIKSLAAEARMIRLEEQKCCLRDRKRRELRRDPCWGNVREEMRYHRIFSVRREASAAQLAYAFLRGKSLSQVEPRVLDEQEQKLVLTRARDLVWKYGVRLRQYADVAQEGEPTWELDRGEALLLLEDEFNRWAAIPSA